jgi:hypothetical protein
MGPQSSRGARSTSAANPSWNVTRTRWPPTAAIAVTFSVKYRFISAEGFDFIRLSAGLDGIPRSLDFGAMLECPFDHEGERTIAHPSREDLQGADLDGDFLFSIDGMKMGNVTGIFARAKEDFDSKEFTEFGNLFFCRFDRFALPGT